PRITLMLKLVRVMTERPTVVVNEDEPLIAHEVQQSFQTLDGTVAVQYRIVPARARKIQSEVAIRNPRQVQSLIVGFRCEEVRKRHKLFALPGVWGIRHPCEFFDASDTEAARIDAPRETGADAQLLDVIPDYP